MFPSMEIVKPLELLAIADNALFILVVSKVEAQRGTLSNLSLGKMFWNFTKSKFCSEGIGNAGLRPVTDENMDL